MKKKLCFAIMILALLYGMCMLDKNGVEMLPTAGEFASYLEGQTDKVADMYQTVRDWAEEIAVLN